MAPYFYGAGKRVRKGLSLYINVRGTKPEAMLKIGAGVGADSGPTLLSIPRGKRFRTGKVLIAVAMIIVAHS